MTGGIGFSRDAQSALKTNRANRDRYKEHQSVMGKTMTPSKRKRRSSGRKKHSTLEIEMAKKSIQDHYRAERIKKVIALIFTSAFIIWLIFMLF